VSEFYDETIIVIRSRDNLAKESYKNTITRITKVTRYICRLLNHHQCKIKHVTID